MRIRGEALNRLHGQTGRSATPQWLIALRIRGAALNALYGLD
jgi:hypothetical protein